VGEVRKVTLEATEMLGHWHVRLVAVSHDEEGEYEEPYVLQTDFSTQDYAGLGWQAACILEESFKRLDAALRDGYE
jgi:hypothetical protein